MFTFMDHQFVFGKKGFVTANLIAHKVQLLGMNVGLVSPPTRSCAVPEKRKYKFKFNLSISTFHAYFSKNNCEYAHNTKYIFLFEWFISLFSHWHCVSSFWNYQKWHGNFFKITCIKMVYLKKEYQIIILEDK